MLKVVCCSHFVRNLNVVDYTFSTFNCSCDQRPDKIVVAKCEQCAFNLPTIIYQELFLKIKDVTAPLYKDLKALVFVKDFLTA